MNTTKTPNGTTPRSASKSKNFGETTPPIIETPTAQKKQKSSSKNAPQSVLKVPEEVEESWNDVLRKMGKRRKTIDKLMKDNTTVRAYIEEACSEFTTFGKTMPKDLERLRELAARVGIDNAKNLNQSELCRELLTGWLTVFGKMVVYPTIRNGTVVVFSMLMLHNFAQLQTIVTDILAMVAKGGWAAPFGLPISIITSIANTISQNGLWNSLTMNPQDRAIRSIWNVLTMVLPDIPKNILISVSSVIKLPKILGYRWVVPELFRTNATWSYVGGLLSKAMPFRRRSMKSEYERIWRVDLPENYLPYGLTIASVTAVAGAVAMFRKYNRDFFFKYDSRLKKLHNKKRSKTWISKFVQFALKFFIVSGLIYKLKK